MPIKFKYDPDINLLYETGLGEVSFREFVEYRERLRDLSVKPGFKVLSDYRKARLTLNPEQMWEVKYQSDNFTEPIGKAKVAIVMPGDLGYGMARMFSMASGSDVMEVSVFRTMADARAWLGMDEPGGAGVGER